MIIYDSYFLQHACGLHIISVKQICQPYLLEQHQAQNLRDFLIFQTLQPRSPRVELFKDNLYDVLSKFHCRT